ncbi:unnamed protein product [Effrenium voratum]|nr:unnamed protein product [Effrenium voratum]
MDRAPYSDGFANLVELPEASAPPPPPPAPSGGSCGGSGGGRGGGMGMMPVPEAMEAAPTVDVQKAVIQHMVEAAKRKRVEAEGPSKPAPKAPTPVAEGSPWLVCTDPKSGAMYYYNKDTKVSAWERPAPAAPDPSKAPPPPAKAPPPPARPGCVGQWQEVLPEDSMWANHAEMEAAREREQRQAAPELFEETRSP